jgi:hypothetical protein
MPAIPGIPPARFFIWLASSSSTRAGGFVDGRANQVLERNFGLDADVNDLLLAVHYNPYVQ